MSRRAPLRLKEGWPVWERPVSTSPGFSLIELLVGMAILALLVVLLGQILSFTSQAWVQNKSGLERLQNLRNCANFIGKELQAALLPTDRSSTNSLQLVVNSGGLSTTQFGHRDTVFWQTPSNVNDSLGDIAEVGYFVRWDTADVANPRPQLCRFFLTASDPANGLAAGASSSFLYSVPAAWLTDAIVNAVAPADKASGYRGLFAENVAGLWVRCLDSAGQPIDKDFSGNSLAAGSSYRYDSRNGFTDSFSRTSPGYQPPGGGPARPLSALPAAVDLGFVMFDSHCAARITPAIQSAIIALVQSSTDARAFMTSAQTAPALAPVRGGLRYYQTRIFLENSK